MLSLADGTVFATGSAPYDFLPENNPRLQVQIEVDGQKLSAAIDTAAPYFICNIATAGSLRITEADHLGIRRLSTRKGVMSGKLYRIPLVLLATEGDSIEIEATTFVPDDESWNDEPLFLGLLCCLDRVRFAVDPGAEKFYFGRAN
jgi:hypothetical protein